MTRTGKAFLFLIYVVAIAVLTGFIVAAFGSTPASAPGPTVQRRQASIAKPRANPAPAAKPALANSGPGNVVVLFGLSSVTGAFVYRRILIRQISRNPEFRA